MTKPIKLMVVGDGGVGKTSMLISYTTNAFPSENVPRLFDFDAASVSMDGKLYTIGLWDTTAQELYDRLRPLSYPGTDIVFVCFDVSKRASLQNVSKKWVPEIKHSIPDVPILLIGCKNDLRSSHVGDESIISYDEAEKLAKGLNLEYADISALTQDGLKSCFDKALRLAVNKIENAQPKKKKGGSKFGGILGKKK